MVTYEDFIKEQRKKGISSESTSIISFGKSEYSVFANIQGDPKDYIDVAKKSKNLEIIMVNSTAPEGFFESLKDFVKEANDEVKIKNGIVGEATKEEFFKGEKIIEELISQIDPNWTDKQKLAFVHYNIPKLISYMPDANLTTQTPTKASIDSRNIWKSLVNEKSVCNGITYIEQNILSRIGIKSRELSSGSHSFLLVELSEGNIITDATWDLTNCLYGAKPEYFGITYEELRQRDQGRNSHKLKNPPEDAIEINDEELREIFYSIGITNEDRSFKFPLFRKLSDLNLEEFETSDEKVNCFLNFLIQNCPEELSHLEETRQIMEMFISQKVGIPNDKITTKYVYDKDDKTCEKPYLISHINDEEMRDTVKFLNLETMSFDDLSIEDLDKQYKQHNNSKTETFWKGLLENKDITSQEIDFIKE